MKDKMGRLVRCDGFNNVVASVIAIIIGLLFGLVVLFITDPSRALEGFRTILLGGFLGGGKGIGQVLYLATPIIMTGLSVAFAFKTGLFNIGASGQFTMGAVTAVFIGVNMNIPAPLHWIVAIIAAMLVGALWGLIPGLLKAYCNVHEVIATIMMNYIGMYLSTFIIKTYCFNTTKSISQDILDSAVLPKLGMDKIFSTTIGTYTDSSVVNIGFLLAIVAAIVIHLLLNRTTYGYELKACGHNPSASKYAGINEKKNIVMAMVIAGALAGIGGALVFLTGPGGRNMAVIEEIALEGFNGIPVALLALSHPLGVIFSGIFIAYLTQAGSYLQMLNYMPELIKIIISCIIYFSAFSLVLRKFVPSIIKRFDEKKEKKENLGGEQ